MSTVKIVTGITLSFNNNIDSNTTAFMLILFHPIQVNTFTQSVLYKLETHIGLNIHSKQVGF